MAAPLCADFTLPANRRADINGYWRVSPVDTKAIVNLANARDSVDEIVAAMLLFPIWNCAGERHLTIVTVTSISLASMNGASVSRSQMSSTIRAYPFGLRPAYGRSTAILTVSAEHVD